MRVLVIYSISYLQNLMCDGPSSWSFPLSSSLVMGLPSLSPGQPLVALHIRRPAVPNIGQYSNKNPLLVAELREIDLRVLFSLWSDMEMDVEGKLLRSSLLYSDAMQACSDVPFSIHGHI